MIQGPFGIISLAFGIPSSHAKENAYLYRWGGILTQQAARATATFLSAPESYRPLSPSSRVLTPTLAKLTL